MRETRKVQTEIFRLRDLVERTRKAQGVRDVESLLHLPGAPAPMHE